MSSLLRIFDSARLLTQLLDGRVFTKNDRTTRYECL